MPAPPKKGETKKQFLGRCIPVFVREGRSQKQAAAICYDMWRKGSESEEEDEIRREDAILQKLIEENEKDERTKRDDFDLYKLTKETDSE